MSTTNVSIRLGVEGKAEVKRAFEEVGQSGTAAFRGVASEMDATGAATDRQAQRLQRLAEAARQTGAADQAQRNFNSVLGVGTTPKSARESAAIFEETAKAAEDLAARTAALRAQIDPLGAAQTRPRSRKRTACSRPARSRRRSRLRRMRWRSPGSTAPRKRSGLSVPAGSSPRRSSST